MACFKKASVLIKLTRFYPLQENDGLKEFPQYFLIVCLNQGSALVKLYVGDAEVQAFHCN